MTVRRQRRAKSLSECAGRRLPLAYEDLARRWILRILVAGGHRLLLEEHFCDSRLGGDRLLQFLGIDTDGEYHREAFREQLFARHHKAERALEVIPVRGPLATNLEWLSRRLGLGEAETAILRFAVLLDQLPFLLNAGHCLGSLNLQGMIHALAVTLHLPSASVREALARKGRLCSIGLLSLAAKEIETMDRKLGLLPGFSDQMLLTHRNPEGLFSGTFTPGRPPSLALEDFPHVEDLLRTAESHLRTSLRTRAKGVHLLIAGIPGVGKTEAARILAQRLGADAYELSAQDGDGMPFSDLRRLRAYQLAQAATARMEKPLLLFDEASDLLQLPSDFPGMGRGNQAGLKAFFLDLLERTPVPTVWVCNSIEECDGALLRRMDAILNFKVPPRNVRERILDGCLGRDQIPEDLRKQIADHPGIAPAWLSRAVLVARSARASDPSLELSPQIRQLLSGRLEAAGAEPLPASATSESCLPYRMDILEASHDLEAICKGLTRHPSARLLLAGPSGTGKTAWGARLAGILGRPLLVRHAGSLLDKYVGETEKKISALFAEATRSNAVLLLDECEGLFYDRREARHHEITLVDTMLCETAAFTGTLVATTNLLPEHFDPAALRRFDLVVSLDYLKPGARWDLFQEAARILGFPADPSLAPGLENLRHLTVGDFDLILRRSRFSPMTDAAALLKALQAQMALKPEGRQRMVGF